MPGRGKKKAGQVVCEDGFDMKDRQTTEYSQENSEYSEGDDHESADINDRDDGLVECLEECSLEGDGEAQTT